MRSKPSAVRLVEEAFVLQDRLGCRWFGAVHAGDRLRAERVRLAFERANRRVERRMRSAP
jgi:hypothetical protein